MIRDKIIAECNFVISDGNEVYLNTIRNVNDYFLGLIVPKNLDGGNKDVVIQFNVQFSQLSIALMTNGIPDCEEMTVFKFYSALKFFESKRKPQTQQP